MPPPPPHQTRGGSRRARSSIPPGSTSGPTGHRLGPTPQALPPPQTDLQETAESSMASVPLLSPRPVQQLLPGLVPVPVEGSGSGQKPRPPLEYWPSLTPCFTGSEFCGVTERTPLHIKDNTAKYHKTQICLVPKPAAFPSRHCSTIYPSIFTPVQQALSPPTPGTSLVTSSPN